MTGVEDSPRARNMTLDDLDSIAELHRNCFPGSISIFSPLNDSILKYYYAQAVEEAESFAAVLEDPRSGSIVGLAIASIKPGFHRRFLRRHFFLFCRSILSAFLVNPVARKAVWERLKYIKRLLRGKFDTELVDLGAPPKKGPEAYFLNVGIHSQWRGGGNAERLVKYFATQMRKKGVTRIRGSVPLDNLPSLILYKCLGWNTKKISADEVCVWVDFPNPF